MVYCHPKSLRPFSVSKLVISFQNAFACSANQRGFTLIELMIVLVIVGVLAAISMPTYSEYVKKSKRTAAKVSLMEIAQSQEKYYAENFTYAQGLSDLGLSAESSGSDTFMTDGNEYLLTMKSTSSAGGACDGVGGTICVNYEALATINGNGVQADDTSCSVFSINNQGEQTASDASNSAANHCWGSGARN